MPKWGEIARFSRRSLIATILLALAISPSEAGARSIRIASAEEGTLYHTFARELAAYLLTEFSGEYNFEALATSGSMDNIERLLVDPSVSLALAQEDVAHYYYTGEGNDFFLIPRTNDFEITCLGRLFSEQFYFVVRPGLRSYADIDSMHVGPLKSGTYVTYTSFRQTQRPLWREIHEGDAKQRFEAGEIDGFFEVNTNPNWTLLDLMNDGVGFNVLPVRRTDFSLGLGLYRSVVIPDSLYNLESNIETISVPTVLLASRNLPRNIADQILQAFRDSAVVARQFPESEPFLRQSINEFGVLSTNDETQRGAEIGGLPLPPHPSLVKITLGSRPFLRSFLAVFFMAALWAAWTMTPQWFLGVRRSYRHADVSHTVYRDGHLLLAAVTWLVLVAVGLKFFETEALINGRAGAGTQVVFMGFFRTLGWLLIFIVSGYSGEFYPGSAIARYLPVTAKIVAYAFSAYVGLRILTSVIRGFLIGRNKMTLQTTKGHVVICNWNQRGLRLVEMLKSEDVPGDRRKRRIAIVTREPISDSDQNSLRCLPVENNPWEETGLNEARIHYADSIIILSPNGSADPDDCDGVVLRTALAVQNHLKKHGDKISQDNPPTIVAELNRQKNREFLEDLGIDEIVISRDIGMRLLAQTVICPGVTTFFNDILDASPDTNEVYQLPLPGGSRGEPADFHRVVKQFKNDENKSSAHRPVLPIGMKIKKRTGKAAENGESNGKYWVLVNPQVEDFQSLGVQGFEDGDLVLVLANEDPS